MKNELISVIIPLYNKEKWVKRTLESVINQSYKNIEIIIVNDGSTDNSLNIVQEFKDDRIKIYSKENGGVSSARNYGIRKSTGKYLALIDADDIWVYNHLQILYNALKSEGDKVILSYSKYNELVDDDFNSKLINKHTNNDNSIAFTINKSYLNDLSRGIFSITSSSVLIRSEYIFKYNLFFDEDMKIGEDINYWLKLNSFTSFICSNEITMYYFRSDTQSAMNSSNSKLSYVPFYFKNINLDSDVYQKNDLKGFIKREFLKKAFQNRGKRFNKNEIEKNENNGTNYVTNIDILRYIVIRFMPNFLFKIRKLIKGKS